MNLIGLEEKFSEAKMYPMQLHGKNLLLIHQERKYYLIENKCGHFGIPLTDGELHSNEIICSGHGISFSLATGEIINRPFEQCDAIKTYQVVKMDGKLFFI